MDNPRRFARELWQEGDKFGQTHQMTVEVYSARNTTMLHQTKLQIYMGAHMRRAQKKCCAYITWFKRNYYLNLFSLEHDQIRKKKLQRHTSGYYS